MALEVFIVSLFKLVLSLLQSLSLVITYTLAVVLVILIVCAIAHNTNEVAVCLKNLVIYVQYKFKCHNFIRNLSTQILSNFLY